MTKKILLADDSITIQKVIGIIFATEDYQLIVCDDGEEAFAKALEEYPDLVIADVSMPGKDGFELCEAIKAQAGLANTSVLLMPGTFEHFDESRAEAVAADGWLSKPFESQALLDKVAQLIDAAPIRPAAAESVPVAAPEVAEEPVAEEVVHDFSAEEPVTAAAVDESVLGLDEIAEDVPVAEDSADDIWDAVSFEEEDLQSAEEPSGSVPSVADTAVEEEDFSFGDNESPLELTDEVVDEAEPEEILELSETDEDEPLELVEEEVVSFAEEPVTEFSAPLEEEVEPLSAGDVEDEDEILDLAEDDILDEELLEEEVVGPIEEVDEFALEDIGEFATEEPVALVDEPEEEEILELSEEAEDVVEEASEPLYEEDDSSLVEPVAAFAAGAAVSTAVVDSDPEPVKEEAVSVERVEQQLSELSEDELKEVVAKVAGPTIEKLAGEMLAKIVWEVVPDLAESMIREEIRKIRQGAGE